MNNNIEICGALPPQRYPFRDLGGGHSDNTECLFLVNHSGPHLYFAKTRNRYYRWEWVDEASNMADLCEECPWASDENLATGEECDCVYYSSCSISEGEQLLKQGIVDKSTRMCAQ